MTRTKRPTLWPLTIEYFDRLPREARDAMRDSNLIGNGDPRLRIARAAGPVMAERLRRVDLMLSPGTNLELNARVALVDCNAILQGRA